MRLRLIAFLIAIACWMESGSAQQEPSQQTPSRRVLVIGVDGVRRDALLDAKTPHFDQLIQGGVLSTTTRILGDRYRENDTVSGPGWSSFLTGVWADKHGVNDNSFENKNYETYPHFFARIRQQFPAARTGSFVNWEPIDQHIVRDADVRKVYPSKGAEGYRDTDVAIKRDAVEFLSSGQPHVAMVYFGAIDETGHQYGFHPTVPEYRKAIETVDGHIGDLIKAMRSRPNFRSEDWLVVISTDHGGRGLGHGGGHQIQEIFNTFLIVSGDSVKTTAPDQPTFVVDVPVIAMTHLGVQIDPAWELDGKPFAVAAE